MFEARRPAGWLFLLLLAVVASAQTIPTTTISDTVYRADGTPAGGTLLISWPEFTTAAQGAVAAGNTSVTLGAGGALSVGLVANANATPANTVYTVVYQLDDGTVKTEYWVVPTTSPTTISAVRTTLGAGNSASQMATEQYVNTALAGKANDAAVVHLAGTEAIVGTKQFTVSPSLPTPVNANDAATKEYVDNATQNVGNGSYVSTAGSTMTGPLTLSGDPVAPEQASTKNYVDLGLAGKAELTAGLVPTGELGTGTANNSLCLHGDSSWGGCGSSSNAISIQNVPVATTTPTNNQVMTYVASAGEYEPEAGGGVTAGMAAVKYATDFSWTQSPASNLSTTGPQTVNLAVCATGVTGTEPWYYVYISGTGTAEAVLVTGGTCTGNGQAGTLQFTTLNAHSSGYTISSASGGLQEALIAARFVASNPSGPSQSGKVIVPPGELQVYARVSVRASNVTIDFSGSIIDCNMLDTCIFAGDPSNADAFLDITLLNPRGRPMVVSGQNPFLEVNAQKTRLLNVTTRIPPTGGTFSSYVQVDNDQSFLLDGLDTALATGSSDYGVPCNASVCNPVIYAPGPFSSNAAVGWLKHLNISLQCSGNGIDWQSGNTVKISDSVIEGYAQYGVRAGIQRGGYGGFELDNVYEEVGSCTNPAGAIGEAGIIAQGATVKVEGTVAPAGAIPQFANSGSTDYRYYVVAHNTTYGASNPLYAGHALTNGSGNITVTTPDIAGATTFDLLRVTYLAPDNPREQAPYGTGGYAVAANVTRASACANGVCTFTDTQATLQSYTVATPSYFPLLNFWPGNLILATNRDSGSVLDAATAWMQDAPSDIVGVQGVNAPAVISMNCNALTGWTPVWLSCYTSEAPGTFYDQGAFLLAVKPNDDGGLLTNLKGRLNFPTLGSGPGHIITLSDSNFQKTIATANNRPSNDANDAFIGYDQGNGNPATVGISLGAPVSLSNYIGNVGDGTNWLERLTSGLKEFKTNVQLDNTLTVAGTARASSLLTTGAGSWAVQGNYGTLSPALTGQSAIGFGAGGQLQVSENGGAVVGVALLDSNGMVSENANTATQLAQAPTQCNGSFVTGIQSNGNANCSVADVVELAETIPPNGIPNYGIFWFDSTCHCPKVISNNGQPVQLGLLNVFNLDANTLEEYNGASPQTLNVYGTRTDASDYERMRLGYDTTDGYFFLGSDALGTSDPQQGLGFWLEGSLRWVIDTSFNLKPWSDNVKDIGTPTLRPKHLYAGTYVDTTAGAVVTDLPNATTTGTTLNKLAKVTGSPATAIIASTSDTNGVIGVVVDGAGTTLSAQIARGGQASCVFDGATTAGDYVQISSTTAGDCHDAGSSYPGAGQVLGRVLSTNASAGTYAMLASGSEVQAPSAGNVNTVFGRAGTITAQAGDYTVGQVTGAVGLVSPAFTGTPTAPTQAASDNSTAIATDAWVKGIAPIIDLRSYCSAGFANCASSDLGAAVSAALTAAGGSVATVDFCGLVSAGPATYYAATNPWAGQSTSMRSSLRMNCSGLTIITSVGWWAPQGSTAIAGISPGASATAGETVLFEPCVTSGGCGPNNYPLFNNCIYGSSCVPAYGNAIVAGPPAAAPATYSTGTCTFTNNSMTVTCSGGTLTQQMIGGNIYAGSTTWGGGSNSCSGRIKSISGSTITLDGYWTGVASNPNSNQCVDASVGSAESYVINGSNAVAIFCVSCLGSATGASSWQQNAFSHDFAGFKIDSEDLSNSIALYNPVGQENVELRNITAAISETHQSCPNSTTGFAGCASSPTRGPNPIAGVMHDYSYAQQSTAGPTHYDMLGVKVDIASSAATSASVYGIVEECWNLTQAKATDGGNVVELGTIPGVNGTLFAAAVYVDGCQSGEIHVNHAEWGEKGIWLGANHPTFGQLLSIRTSNYETGSTKSNVYFDANAGSCNTVWESESQAATTVLINDTVNGVTINNSSSNKVQMPYIQPCPLASWINGVNITQGALTSGTVNATTGFQVNGSATSNHCLLGNGTNYVDSANCAPLASPTFTGTPAAPTASTGDNSTKLATTAYVRGESQMTFTCPVAGAGAVVQYCNWTLPAAITVTGFDLAAGTAPLTCSTYATLQVWDGTAGAEVGSYSITMNSGNNFYSQVTGSTNVPAAHLLRVKVTTAAAGCGTVAAGIAATVTYQMEN